MPQTTLIAVRRDKEKVRFSPHLNSLIMEIKLPLVSNCQSRKVLIVLRKGPFPQRHFDRTPLSKQAYSTTYGSTIFQFTTRPSVSSESFTTKVFLFICILSPLRNFLSGRMFTSRNWPLARLSNYT